MAQLYENTYYKRAQYNNEIFYDFRIVHIGNNSTERISGVKQNISNGYIKRNNPSFEVIFFHIDSTKDLPKTMTRQELDDFNKILFAKEEVGTLVVGDDVYYGIFTDAKSNVTKDYAYITTTFQLTEPYKFSAVQEQIGEIVNSKTFKINNISNAVEKIPLNIEIKITKGTTAKITNKTEVLEITGLNKSDSFWIYGDTKEIISPNHPNMFSKSNRNFKAMELEYGENEILVQIEDGTVRLNYQYKMCL